jgi:hypothetical protein
VKLQTEVEWSPGVQEKRFLCENCDICPLQRGSWGTTFLSFNLKTPRREKMLPKNMEWDVSNWKSWELCKDLASFDFVRILGFRGTGRIKREET